MSEFHRMCFEFCTINNVTMTCEDELLEFWDCTKLGYVKEILGTRKTAYHLEHFLLLAEKASSFSLSTLCDVAHSILQVQNIWEKKKRKKNKIFSMSTLGIKYFPAVLVQEISYGPWLICWKLAINNYNLVFRIR